MRAARLSSSWLLFESIEVIEATDEGSSGIPRLGVLIPDLF